jgi:hypothetical protein
VVCTLRVPGRPGIFNTRVTHCSISRCSTIISKLLLHSTMSMIAKLQCVLESGYLRRRTKFSTYSSSILHDLHVLPHTSSKSSMTCDMKGMVALGDTCIIGDCETIAVLHWSTETCVLVFDSLVKRFTGFFFEKYYCCIELYRANELLGSISNFNNWLGTVIPF